MSLEREQLRSFSDKEGEVEARVYCGDSWSWTVTRSVGDVDFVPGFRSMGRAKQDCTQHLKRHGLKALGRTWEDG